jgi:hypothetical protein
VLTVQVDRGKIARFNMPHNNRLEVTIETGNSWSWLEDQ